MTTYAITTSTGTAHIKSDSNKARAVKRATEWAGSLAATVTVVVTNGRTGAEVARVSGRVGALAVEPGYEWRDCRGCGEEFVARVARAASHRSACEECRLVGAELGAIAAAAN